MNLHNWLILIAVFVGAYYLGYKYPGPIQRMGL